MDNLFRDFRTVGSHALLRQFVSKYALQSRPSTSTFDMGSYSGLVGGLNVVVSHRWYDRCRPFVIQEDGNEITLEATDATGSLVGKEGVKYNED